MIKIIVFVCLATAAVCQMPGGISNLNMSDPQVEKDLNRLANFALKEIAAKRTAVAASEGKPQKPLVYSLLKIVSARSQIVSGVKYYIEVKFRDSLCPKTNTKQNRRSLSSASCLHPEQCEVTVWEQPWLNHTELVSYECKQKSSAQVGVRQRISNKDEHALKALDFAVLKMNLEAVNERAYFKPQILNTYRQVVSGFKYTFLFKFAPTNCEKHENLSMLKADDCVFVTSQQPVNEGMEKLSATITNSDDIPKTRNCKVSVHDQPWLNDPQERYKVTNVNCF